MGMRERLRVYGGEVTTGPRPGGGWEVAARLPLAGPIAKIGV
jgi:signal transduction histidine kinase